jgi:transcriptional regulator with XRE-family HTH domain
MRLSQALRQGRAAKGWTQRELARRVKVTTPYITQLELGLRTNPSLPVLRRLAKALGVPVARLLE